VFCGIQTDGPAHDAVQAQLLELLLAPGEEMAALDLSGEVVGQTGP